MNLSAKLLEIIAQVRGWLLEHGFEKGLADKSLQKPLVIGVLVIVASLLWRSAASERLASLRVQMAAEKDRGKVISDYREAMAILDSLAAEVGLAPEADPREWIQSETTSLATAHSLDVVSSELKGEKPLSSEISILEWNFVFRGTYYALGAFMASIENHKPVIGVSDLDFTRAGLLPGRGALLEIRTTLYVVYPKPRGPTAQGG